MRDFWILLKKKEDITQTKSPFFVKLGIIWGNLSIWTFLAFILPLRSIDWILQKRLVLWLGSPTLSTSQSSSVSPGYWHRYFSHTGNKNSSITLTKTYCLSLYETPAQNSLWTERLIYQQGGPMYLYTWKLGEGISTQESSLWNWGHSPPASGGQNHYHADFFWQRWSPSQVVDSVGLKTHSISDLKKNKQINKIFFWNKW